MILRENVIHLDVSVDQPVELEILIVITEGIDQLFGNFQKSHVEEELEDGVDGDVEVNIERDTTTGHSRGVVLYLLSANDGEDEEEVGGEGDDLGVDHGDGDPVVAPEQSALGSELTELLPGEIIINLGAVMLTPTSLSISLSAVKKCPECISHSLTN